MASTVSANRLTSATCLQQLDLVVGERPWLGTRHSDDADGGALPHHGYPEAAPKADRAPQRLCELWIDLDVGDVDHRASEDRPPTSDGPGWAHREYAARLLEAFGGDIVLAGKMNQFAVEPKQRGEEPVAQPHGALDDDVEDGLEVRR
jgi:hypothetical protein